MSFEPLPYNGNSDVLSEALAACGDRQVLPVALDIQEPDLRSL